MVDEEDVLAGEVDLILGDGLEDFWRGRGVGAGDPEFAEGVEIDGIVEDQARAFV